MDEKTVKIRIKKKSQAGDIWRRFLKNKTAVLGLSSSRRLCWRLFSRTLLFLMIRELRRIFWSVFRDRVRHTGSAPITSVVIYLPE